MTAFLTLLVVCCAARSVSAAAAPLHFMYNFDDPGLLEASELLAEEVGSDATSRTMGNANPIFFPGTEPSDGGRDPTEITSSGDAASGHVWLPGELGRGVAPLEGVTECMVSENLTVTHNGVTWKLLTQGNCPEGEWAVMVAKCKPECRPRPCPVGELEYEGRCVDPADSTVCGESKTLYLNQRGTTYCDCEQNYFYYPWSGHCYARRQRGWCDFGFFLDLNQNGDVECVPNECKTDIFEKEPDSGKCYRKNYVGYCPVDTLDFYHSNQTVGCLMIHNRNLFDRHIVRSCQPGSFLTYRNECRPEVVIPALTSQPRSLDGGCGRGQFRIGNGPCRSINTFFS